MTVFVRSANLVRPIDTQGSDQNVIEKKVFVPSPPIPAASDHPRNGRFFLPSYFLDVSTQKPISTATVVLGPSPARPPQSRIRRRPVGSTRPRQRTADVTLRPSVQSPSGPLDRVLLRPPLLPRGPRITRRHRSSLSSRSPKRYNIRSPPLPRLRRPSIVLSFLPLSVRTRAFYLRV